jgi:hypothetical protein
MADENKAATAVQTPAAAPAPANTANANAQALSEQGGGAGQKDLQPGVKGPLNPNPVAMGAAPTRKFPARSTLITNPEPEEVYREPEEPELPASTIAEMEAGKAALNRNKPSAVRAQREARERDQRQAGGNPVDATQAGNTQPVQATK